MSSLLDEAGRRRGQEGGRRGAGTKCCELVRGGGGEGVQLKACGVLSVVIVKEGVGGGRGWVEALYKVTNQSFNLSTRTTMKRS